MTTPTAEVTAGMTNVLNTHDPSTLPMAISAFPCLMAEILTANSGKVVPNDNTVSAMIDLGMLNEAAMSLIDCTV